MRASISLSKAFLRCGRNHAFLQRKFLLFTLSRSYRKTAALRNATETQKSTPTIAECPSPTCDCAPMPIGLDIDYEKPMRGAMPLYSKHIVINTGKEDWSSRIENESDGHNLAMDLKSLIGPKGKYYDPQKNIIITNGSLPTSSSDTHSISLFPQCLKIEDIRSENLDSLAQDLVTSKTPLDFHSFEQHSLRKYRSPVILICGHNSRDNRCGVMGPLLRDEFLRQIQRTASQSRSTDAVELCHELENSTVEIISHIGGHAWAGNVIIYSPPEHRMYNGMLSPLAAKGVWYGRVGPQHVEGIVKETIGNGRIIDELLRGVHASEDCL